MKKTRIIIFITAIFILSFLILHSGLFTVAEINVNKLENFTKEEVLNELDLKLSDNLYSTNLSKNVREFKKNPYIISIKVKRVLPNKINIEVDERLVRGYVPYMGSYLYIDEEGLVLDSSKEIKEKIPIFLGLEFDSFQVSQKIEAKDENAYNAIIKMSNLLKNYDFSSTNLRVDISKMSDIHIFVDEVDIVLGNIKDCDKKIRVAYAALEKLPEGVKGTLYLNESQNKGNKIQYRFQHLT